MKGSPAWAGIDPTPAGTVRPLTRFPRMGGDRPTVVTVNLFGYAVPPHGRG